VSGIRVVAAIIHNREHTQRCWRTNPSKPFPGSPTGLTLLGTMLLIGGACRALYRPVGTAGLLGLVGFLMDLGNVLVAGAVWEATFVVPWLAWEAPTCWTKGPHGG
jgi:hypothetical protein